MILTLVDQDVSSGQHLLVKAEWSENRRGRGRCERLLVEVDGEVCYEGPDGPEADQAWKPLLASAEASPPSRRKKEKK